MELTYWEISRYRDMDCQFGLNLGDWRIQLLENDGKVAKEFLEALEKVRSLKAILRCGTATLRKEQTKYWFAYKKVGGKLNKVYLGIPNNWTIEYLESAIEKVCMPKESNPDHVRAVKPKKSVLVDLAGHGKSDDHIQQNLLVLENERLSKLVDELKIQVEQVENLKKTISTLEKDLSYRDQDYEEIRFMYDSEHGESFNLFCKLQHIEGLIGKYRDISKGKTRQGHPRFNKLLDFLDDIDKFGLLR